MDQDEDPATNLPINGLRAPSPKGSPLPRRPENLW